MNSQKICRNCKYWVKDYGIWCMNGWSGIDKDNGRCHLTQYTIYKEGKDFCGSFSSKEDGATLIDYD